jgi:hypothetical protein
MDDDIFEPLGKFSFLFNCFLLIRTAFYRMGTKTTDGQGVRDGAKEGVTGAAGA